MKICFWGDISQSLAGGTKGGGELQIALFAKALANCGNEVVIVDYEVTEDFVTPEGIQVCTVKGWHSGIPVIRTITHRLPALYKSLKAQHADIYYCRIRDFRHILAYRAARKGKGKFVMAVASDLDVAGFRQRLKYQYLLSMNGWWSLVSGLLIEILQPRLLRKADLVFVQHEGQKNTLLKKNIDSFLFPNLIDLKGIPAGSSPRSEDFIYVGSLDKRKGFGDFFKLVTKTPFFSYRVIGQPRDKMGVRYFDQLKKMKNVVLTGRLSHVDTLKQIASSKALISTSPMEGFPNVFLEAWACGIPVLSLYVDPGVIESHQLGKVTHGDLNALIEKMKNFDLPPGFAEKAKSYVNQHHVLNEEKYKEINRLILRINQAQP